MILRRLFELFDRLMGGQWGCPHGPLGWLAGKLMERGNAAMNELGLEALAVQPGSAVLEIGFGPGAALERIAELVGEGSLAGIDPSEQMVRWAARRLRQYVDAGRADLRQGYSSDMPFPDASFDRVLSVNTVYFWEDPQSDLREIRRVVKPGGRFVLVFRATQGEDGGLQAHGMAKRTPATEVADWMRGVGFGDLSERRRETSMGPLPVTAVALTGVVANPS